MSALRQAPAATPAPLITGLGTALPDYAVEQGDLADFISDYLGHDRSTAAITRRIFRSAQIDQRYTMLPDFGDPAAALLYVKGSIPTLEERMAAYQRDAPRIATRAAERALEQAQLDANEITHLIVVTSTAAYAPGPEIEIARRLGVPAGAERSLICMMGCSGAFNGLSIASRSVALNPAARALVVCVELSSIHLQPNQALDGIVAQSLFGDGAAAAVLRSDVSLETSVAQLGSARSHLEYPGRELVTWKLSGSGFSIGLEKGLVDVIAKDSAEFLTPLIREAAGSEFASDCKSWVIHPGGPKIVNSLEGVLGLAPDALGSAREIYRNGGNLSSASVLFVLERESTRCPAGTGGVMFAVGPGLALEGLAFTHGGR